MVQLKFAEQKKKKIYIVDDCAQAHGANMTIIKE